MAAAAKASVDAIIAANSAPCTQDQPRLAKPSTKRMRGVRTMADSTTITNAISTMCTQSCSRGWGWGVRG